MRGMSAASLLSPSKVAKALGISPEEALDLMLTGGIRTVSDNGVPMVPEDAIEEFRDDHAER